MPDKIKILYDAVSKDYNVGNFDEFQKKLQDDSKRKAFYDGVGSEYNLGNFEEFSIKVKKKEPTTTDLQSGSPISTRPFDVFQTERNKKNTFNAITGEVKPYKEPKEEKPKVYKEVDLSLTTNKKNLKTPSITNTSSFLDDIGAKLAGDRYSPIAQEFSEKLKNINSAYSNQPVLKQLLEKPLKEDKIYQGKEDSERNGNRALFVYNELLNGLGGLVSGIGDLGSQLIYSGGVSQTRDRFQQSIQPNKEQKQFQEEQIKNYRENIAPEIRGFLKEKIGADVDKVLENKYKEETITGALGGLAQTVPSIALTTYSGGAGSAAMFAQTFDSSIQSINNTEEGRNLDEATKTYFATGVGIVSTALEKFGLDKIFKGETGTISNLIAKKALKNATKETGGKVTGDIFTKFLDKEVINLSNKYLKGGAKALDAAITEYGTGSLQEASTISAELLTNKLTGKPVFDTTDVSNWQGFLKRVNKAGTAEAIGGGLIGTVAALSNSSKQDIETKQKKINEINKSLNNENISEPAKEIILKNKIEAENELENITNEINDNYIKLTDEQKTKVKNIADEKIKLEKDLSNETLENDIKKQIQDKIDELDNQLSDISKEQPKPKENAIQEPITTEEVSRIGETGENNTEGSEGVRPSEQGKETTQEAKEVETLRAEEQAELKKALPNTELTADGKVDKNKITDKEDLKKYEEIYKKYDSLITPLLEKGKKSEEDLDKNFVINEIKNGAIDWDGDMSNPRPVLGLDWKEIRKGKEDLLNGKDTAAAKKLTQAILEAKKQGGYDFVAGGGKLKTDFFVPIFGSFAVDLTPSELEYVAKNEQQLSKEYDNWFNNLSDKQKQDELNSIENGRQKTDANAERKSEENVSNQETSKNQTEEVNIPELKDDSLDLAIEVANDISLLKEKQKRAKSKVQKETIAKQIADSEIELQDIPTEAKIAKGINDNFDKIKTELKKNNVIEIKGC